MEIKTKKGSSLSGSVDSISSLPDEMLAHILSFLPTKRAASTSIISKRWMTLFPIMNLLCSSLCYDDSDLLYPDREREESVVQDSFRDFVDKTLSVCYENYNPLKKFSLKCHLDDDVHRMDLVRRWISKAWEHDLSDLDLRISMPLMHKPRRSLLPNTFFINNTLVNLTLGTELCLGASPLDRVSLPLLKSLSLHTVWFTDHSLCDLMLEDCPELEELYIHYNYIRDRKRKFKIHPAPHFIDHDNIKKLTVHYNNDAPTPRVLSIYTPSLVYLDYSDYLTCIYESEDCFDALLEARLNLLFPRSGRWGCYERDTCLKIVNSITTLQILYLSSSTVEVMYACLDLTEIPLFKNLVTLHFEGCKKEYWILLCNMIAKAPKLETLVLQGLCRISDNEVNIDGGNVVKVVEIQGYKGSLEELNQVKCFLREMENLEQMNVNISDETENKLQLTNDLLALPKRSSKCNIHVL